MNLIYEKPEAAIVFRDSGGTNPSPTQNFTLANLAAGAARQSARHDYDAGTLTAKGRWFKYTAFCEFETTPVVGESVKWYLKSWYDDGGTLRFPDNDNGTTDAAVSALDKLRNLPIITAVQVDEAATGVKFVKHGVLYVPSRAFQVICHNDTADNLQNNAAGSGFVLVPLPAEIQ